MPILGLCSTETYDADRFKNIRRSVQYFYPNGAAPLTGILSLMDEETTNDPRFSHWEKRLSQQRTLTVVNDHGYVGAGAFTTTVPGNLGATFTWTQDTSYRVHVADASLFRVGHEVKIVATIAGIDKDLTGIVEGTSTAGVQYITVRAVVGPAPGTIASVPNAVGDIGDEVLVVGTAFAQGVVDISSEVYNLPTEFRNYSQIFRTPFSMTGTALKGPVKYDETGAYKDKSKEHSIQHMIEIEKAMLFGIKHKFVASGTASPTTGAGLPVYTTGGILYHLNRWEAGDYGTVVATADTDEDKRVINNTAGTITEKQYDGYLERVFRVTNNTSNEKLVLCGGSFLQVMNQMYRSKSVLNADLPLTDTYGMNVVKHLCPFGTVYYKTHPLFTQNAILRYCALFLDVRNMKYRPMVGRDTELLKNRQPNDADYRKDEYLTECGLEMWFPESFMFMKNVRDWTL